MSETKHTPGPWELIETPHEKIISSWHIKVGDHQISVHPYKRIWNEDRTQSGLVTDYQHMADARLIAAAPEMLEALKVCAAHIGNMPHPDFVNGGPIDIVYAQALQAIAKAEGRQADREEPTP